MRPEKQRGEQAEVPESLRKSREQERRQVGRTASRAWCHGLHGGQDSRRGARTTAIC